MRGGTDGKAGRAAAADRSLVPAFGEDGRLHPMDKMAVHRSGQKHLAVSVFLFCGELMLIQQRAAAKYHCGGLWANTCCTHPLWSETPDACAARRLQEEVGLSHPLVERAVVEYRAAVTGGLIENERVHVFEGELLRPILPQAYDPAEVSALRWISRRDLLREVADEPERFTPWLRIYLERWPELALRSAA